MKKKILTIVLSSIVFSVSSAEFIMKQKVQAGVAFNTTEIDSNFTSHTFTNCGQTGRFGPTLSQCKSSYNTTWDEDSNNFNMTTQGYQIWTVPETATYKFEVAGAKGGDALKGNSSGPNPTTGGLGAIAIADFSLTKGDKITIIVGQRGHTYINAGGSGGSFVVDSNDNPLLVAGGGGAGGGVGRETAFQDAQSGNNGGNGYGSSGGTSGNGGTGGDGQNRGAGGAGFLSNGRLNTEDQMHGRSYANGLTGGDSFSSHSNGEGYGGFGGGGAGGYHSYTGYAGGGGGYSGGGGGSWNNGGGEGGGGGSYSHSSASNVSINITNTGTGYVTVTKL